MSWNSYLFLSPDFKTVKYHNVTVRKEIKPISINSVHMYMWMSITLCIHFEPAPSSNLYYFDVPFTCVKLWTVLDLSFSNLDWLDFHLKSRLSLKSLEQGGRIKYNSCDSGSLDVADRLLVSVGRRLGPGSGTQDLKIRHGLWPLLPSLKTWKVSTELATTVLYETV